MKKSLALAALYLTTALTTPAWGAPVGAAIGAIAGAIGVSSAAVALVAINLTVSAVMSAVQRARMKKNRPEETGLKTERKLYGGINSRSIMLGYYATAGAEVCPPMSQGSSGKTPNAFLTYVIALGDTPSGPLSNRIVINGEWVPIDWNTTAEYGSPIGGKYNGKAWIKYYNGTQTQADPMLVQKFAGYQERPWTAQHVGRGIPYAIVTFQYDNELHKAEPQMRFEMLGSRLYDPRQDGSRGGSGPQRWNNPATWGAGNINPVVMIYNILLGIPLSDGRRYGASATLDDLPLANWVAAMNACDEQVNIAGGGTEARFRAGYEILVADDEPGDVIDELLKACLGSIVEIGGIYKIRVGAPGLPVMFLNDGDFLITKDQELDPFPATQHSRNTLNSSFPHPAELWLPHDAPTVSNPDYIAEDGDEILAADVPLPAVPFPVQAQRNMQAWLKDDRRWRSHGGSLGPYGLPLEPLDTVEWTSARNGYSGKLFEITSSEENLKNLCVGLGFRECDPADYDWSPSMQLPDSTTNPAWELPETQVLPDFNVIPYIIRDSDNEGRRPGIRVTWDSEAADDARAVVIQWRRFGSQEFQTKTVGRVSVGVADITEGLIPLTEYEVRAILDVDRPVEWTAWVSVTTDDIRIKEKDLDEQIFQDFEEIAARAGIKTVSELPLEGDFPNQLIMLVPPGQLYRWDAVANEWTQEVYAGLPDGSVDITKLASSIQPPMVWEGPSLPTTRQESDVLLFNGNLYRWDGSEYVSSVLTEDLIGQITSSQIDEFAVTAQKLADNAVERNKIVDGAINAGKLANNAVTTVKIANNAITDAKIAGVAASKVTGQLTNDQIAAVDAAKIAGQLTDDQIAEIDSAKLIGQILAGQIANNAVTADKIANNAVTASKLLDNAVTETKISNNAITTEKIRAGAIGADQIAARAITSDKMLIGSAANLFSNPDFAEGREGWFGNADFAIAEAVGSDGELKNIIRVAATNDSGRGFSNLDWSTNSPNAVSPGSSYRVSMVARLVSGDSGEIYIRSLQREGANGSNSWPTVTGTRLLAADATPGEWVELTGVITMQGNRNYLAVQVLVLNSSGTVWEIDKLSMRVMGTGELIVDGAIGADQIAANAVNADKIAANAVNADKIAANAVNADKIAANAVIAEKISAGAVETAKLAAGAVVADKIAANAVTTAKLEAGAVTTAKLAAGSVEAEKIAAGAVIAGKIAANAVEADNIAANAITSGKIAANAVTAGKLAAGSVEADKIAAGAVIAGKIAANAVGADEIAARAVLASKLVVAGSENLIRDPEYYDFGTTANKYWFGRALANFTVVRDVNPNNYGQGSLLQASGIQPVSGSGEWAKMLDTQPIPVEVNTQLYAAMNIWNLAPARFMVRVGFYTGDDGTGYNGSIALYAGTRGAGLFRPSNDGQVPAGTSTMRFEIFIDRTAHSTISAFNIGRALIRTKNGGELIVNGAITTDKIAAGAVEADQIAANAITVGKIAAGAIGADQIAANAITVGKIENNAVTNAKIAGVNASKIAGQLTGTQIADNGITTPKLATNAITADKIDTGAVTANAIAANAVTASKIAVGQLSAISSNLGSITAGSLNINNRFIVAANGTTTITEGSLNINDRFIVENNGATTIRSGTTGERMVITESRIDVYDNNNVLRVRMGQL